MMINTITTDLKQIANLFQLLKKDTNETKYEQLIHNIIDTISGRGPGVRLNELIDEQQGTDTPLSLIEIQGIVDAVKLFVQRVMSKELSTEDIKKELKALGVENDNHLQLIVRVIEGRRQDLTNTMQRLTVEQLSQAYLHDFDWKIHLVIASDKCSNIREPVLLLSLRIKKQLQNQDILVELTREDLDRILNDFAKVQNVLQKITM
jgi:hypothetical protein